MVRRRTPQGSAGFGGVGRPRPAARSAAGASATRGGGAGRPRIGGTLGGSRGPRCLPRSPWWARSRSEARLRRSSPKAAAAIRPIDGHIMARLVLRARARSAATCIERTARTPLHLTHAAPHQFWLGLHAPRSSSASMQPSTALPPMHAASIASAHLVSAPTSRRRHSRSRPSSTSRGPTRATRRPPPRPPVPRSAGAADPWRTGQAARPARR